MRRVFLAATIAALMPATVVMAQQGNPVARAEASNVCGPVGVADAQFTADGRIAVVCNPGGPPAGTTGSVAATNAGVGAAAAGLGLAVIVGVAASDDT